MTASNKCRRCGEKLENNTDLRCWVCRKYVDEELNGEKERDLDFYFRFYRNWKRYKQHIKKKEP